MVLWVLTVCYQDNFGVNRLQFGWKGGTSFHVYRPGKTMF